MATDKETRTLEIVLKAQDANASLKEMGAGAAVMNAQLSKMGQDDPGRAKLLQDFQELNGRITEQRAEMRLLLPTQQQQAAEQEKLRQAAEAEREAIEQLQAAQEQLNQERIESIAQGKLETASLKEMKTAASLLEVELTAMSQDDPNRAALQRDFTVLQQRIAAARAEMTTYVKTADELAAEQATLAEQTARLNQENIQIVVNGQKVAATYNEMDAAAKRLEKDIKDLTPGTAEFIKKSKELQEVKGRMDEVDKSVKGTEKSTWAAKLGFEGITSASGLMKFAFQAAMAALLPLLAIEKVWELVQGFVGLVNEVDQVKSAINTATGAQGEMLDTLYTKVQTLSRTFGDDYADVLKGADVLAKQMGISHEEAFDIMEKGYLAGANRSGEMLEHIQEYSVQMKAAGFTAEEFVSHIANAEMGGVFSDKGVDTVKEFGLRIREQTTATRDAMDGAFGQDFTNRIFKGINDGSMTVKQAMQEVSTAMNSTQVNASQLQTVVADVFGGPGEDAGTAYLQSLGNIDKGLDGLIDSSNAYVQMQQEQLAANKMLVDSEAYLTKEFAGSGQELQNLWATTKAYVFYGIGNLVQGIKQISYELVAGGAYLKSWGSTVATVFEALMNRDWSAAKSAFSKGGSDAAAAYRNSYAASMKAGEAEMTAAAALSKKQELDAAKAEQLKHDAQTRKEKEDAAKKAAKDQEAEHKRQAAELKKAREEAAKADLALQRSIEDLQVSTIQNKYDREIAEINLQTDRKMGALEGDFEQVMAQWEMLEQLRQEKIAGVRDKQKEDDQARKEEDAQIEAETTAANDELYYAELALKFERGLLNEQAYNDALYELRQVALTQQLEQVRQMKGEESNEYKRINAQIILGEAGRVKQQKALKQEMHAFELRMNSLSFALLREGLQLVEDNLSKKTLAYQAFKAFRKAAAIAEVGMNLIEELSDNALSAGKTSVKYGPQAGAIQLGITNGLSIVRAIGSSIKIAAFEKGGNTTRVQNLIESRQALAILSGASGGSQAPGGSFAGGGPVNKATIGLIGEAGAELVIPNWMYADPKQADLMGFLEAQIASRGGAFANGGSTVGGFSAAAGGSASGEEPMMVQLMQQLVTAHMDFRQEISEWQRSLEVNNNLQEVRRGLEVINQAQNGGGVRLK